MPKISNRPLKKLTRLRIWEDDYQYLKGLFSSSELGLAGAIREILSEYVSTVKHRTAQTLDRNTTPATLTPDQQEGLDSYLKGIEDHEIHH